MGRSSSNASSSLLTAIRALFLAGLVATRGGGGVFLVATGLEGRGEIDLVVTSFGAIVGVLVIVGRGTGALVVMVGAGALTETGLGAIVMVGAGALTETGLVAIVMVGALLGEGYGVCDVEAEP